MSDEKHTLKSVQSEIRRLETARQKKTEKIDSIRAEIRETDKRLKELKKLEEQLYQEEMQHKFMAMFPKGTMLTAEQMNKFMEIGKHVIEKIDILDTDAAAQAIGLACEESAGTSTSDSTLQLKENTI